MTLDKVACSRSRYDTFQLTDNKGADQTARIRRLVSQTTEDRFSRVEAL